MADAVLSSAVRQVSTFLREESSLLGGVRDEVQHIKDELGQMKGFLRKAEAMVDNVPDLESWVSQVRNVAYDIEDVLDEFILRFGSHYGDGFLGRVRKVGASIMNLKARHQIASKIHTIKDRIKYISEAHQRYQNQFELGSSSSAVVQNQNTWYDSRGDALLLEEADLIGIERPKKKLTDMLFTNDSQLRVISVVGMGGLGKTTLVKKVYDDPNIKKRFKHHVWITVSQSFMIEILLRDTIQQLFVELNQPVPHELDNMGVDRMKQLIWEFLHEENFILVFDDIWRTSDWHAIRIAFPKNSFGSRIIVTTRIIVVGKTATSDIGGDIYPLQPLTKEESWNLFCRKAFGATSCPYHLEEICGNIIERCAGLPLAIVVIGGVMATKSRRTEDWDLFNRSLSEQLVDDDQLENMTKLLSFSYYDLPDHLRICLLYLSILPEDVSIDKGRLIRLWMAEGFVQKRNGMTIEEVAEGYLNELINRSLVQVADKFIDERLKDCCVHDIVQQIILRKAREQEITTILSEQGIELPNKVRRLIIHNSIANPRISNGLLKCLRSLVLFQSIDSMFEFPELLSSDDLRHLSVLELRGAPIEEIPREIFKMLHLKYLGLRGTKVKIVPKSIGKLQKLETLDLKHSDVTKLPVEILKLQQLRHLLVGKRYTGFQAPKKIGNLQSLQSLCNIDADQMDIVKEIGKLSQLRRLRITKLRKEYGKEFCSSLEKLTNLRSILVVSIYKEEEEEVINLQYSLSSTPRFLHTLKLSGRFEKAPQWILSLHGLARIHLRHCRLWDDPLQVLQDLPNLIELVLNHAYQGEGFCFKAGGFQRLKRLWMSVLPEFRWVKVENGTMPLLEQLVLGGSKLMEELPAGIEHLRSLQYLEFLNMSDTFVKMLEDMEKQNGDYKNIAHIPQVLITYWYSDGEQKRRYLSITTHEKRA